MLCMPSRGRVSKREAVDVEDIAVSFRHDRSFVDAHKDTPGESGICIENVNSILWV